MSTNPQAQPEMGREQTEASGPPPFPPREIGWHRKALYPEDPRFKSPALATFLSLMPGLGQVYVGYYRQGFINVIVIGSLISLISPGPDDVGRIFPLMVFFLVFYWLYNLVDAARRASFYNQALSGVPPTELPQEFTMPERHGSLLWGGILILAGVVIASHTILGYSLVWLERWWPAALILVGVYLVTQSWLEKKREREKI